MSFQGHFKVCHALHCRGDRWRHIDGGTTEDDACGSGVQNISLHLWG